MARLPNPAVRQRWSRLIQLHQQSITAAVSGSTVDYSRFLSITLSIDLCVVSEVDLCSINSTIFAYRWLAYGAIA